MRLPSEPFTMIAKEVDKLKNEFMMITSHNLRTPLTIINSYLDDFPP